MKKNSKEFIRILILAIIFLSINHLTTLYFNNKIMQISTILVLSLILTFVLLILQKSNSIKEIIEHVSNINNLDFLISDNVNIQPEIREKIYTVANQIKGNLKTQVELSTDIFNECEQLNYLSIDSLTSAEHVAASVEVADANTSQQSHMLNETNTLTNEINIGQGDRNTSQNLVLDFIFIIMHHMRYTKVEVIMDAKRSAKEKL